MAHALVALGLLATVVAAGWAAQQVHLLWVFWSLFVVSALYGLWRSLGGRAWSRIRLAYTRVRKYEQVAQAGAEAVAEVQDLKARLAAAESETFQSRTAGIIEGRRQVVAEMLGERSAAALTPLACLVEAGIFLIVARLDRGELPTVKSRLFLQVANSKAKAALRVVDVAPHHGNVSLEVDEIYDAPFMDGLQERAIVALSDPPAGATVLSRVVNDLTDLEQGVNG